MLYKTIQGMEVDNVPYFFVRCVIKHYIFFLFCNSMGFLLPPRCCLSFFCAIFENEVTQKKNLCGNNPCRGGLITLYYRNS